MAKSSFQVARLPGFATMAMLAFMALYIPIFTLVVYSFNSETTLGNWGEFSWQWYVKAWDNQAVKDATMRSLVIASFAAVFSTILATMAALGTTRRRACG